MWKSKALMVLETMDYHMPEILKNGPYVPHITATKDGVPGEKKATPVHEFTEDDTRLVNLDTTLTVAFEGTAEVIAAQENTLNRKYEHFFAYKNETITQTFNRFNCLVNDMRRFNIVKLDSVLVLKFLDSLDDKWEHHVDVLKNSEKICTMDLQRLFGNLCSHEEIKAQRKEIMRDSQHERSAALFSKNQEDAEFVTATSEESDAEDEEFKHMADLASQATLIVKQFNQYKDSRRNGAQRFSGGFKPNFSNFKKSIIDSPKPTGDKRNDGKCFNWKY
ncbi:hypothetical protein L2E82_17100 [Cichorium intybus]|uniref:Uncharacterized protein n=1 Tax=Cichorium intybus TaxID=13427 RepID=A0ACB9F6T8_CICIN|nr:hypothetical protein L2E82_17100 [Cichorium intybus]